MLLHYDDFTSVPFCRRSLGIFTPVPSMWLALLYTVPALRVTLFLPLFHSCHRDKSLGEFGYTYFVYWLVLWLLL
jgi:hypothetical protein